MCACICVLVYEYANLRQGVTGKIQKSKVTKKYRKSEKLFCQMLIINCVTRDKFSKSVII